MNPADYFPHALSYNDFLAQHGEDGDQRRWQQVYDQSVLSDEQLQLLGSLFARSTYSFLPEHGVVTVLSNVQSFSDLLMQLPPYSSDL